MLNHTNSLFLIVHAINSASVVPTLALVLSLLALFVLAVACMVFLIFFLKRRHQKNIDKKIQLQLAEANAQCKALREETDEKCKTLQKEALLEIKEQELKLHNEYKRKISEKEQEWKKNEDRLQQREDNLLIKEEQLLKNEDKLLKKEDDLSKKLEEQQKFTQNLVEKEKQLEEEKEKIANQHLLIQQELEKIAQLTTEEAKNLLKENILDETRREVLKEVRLIEQTARDEAENKAKNIISLAIQRCASEHTTEMNVSVVALPNDDMKARIIGREGRNIRALENATGIEFIVDDTPEVVILSGFDPIRREVARLALEKLVSDGRIHPARIEETVEKVKKELDKQIKEYGEAAVYELGIYNMHPEIIKTVGKLKYRTSYGQNIYKHSIECAHLAGTMAAELGLDINLAKRGALLHDIGKALDQEQEGTHVQLGVELAKRYKESAKVINCIMAHHGDEDPKTPEAVLVMAADTISGARPGARRESTTNYLKRLEQLESIASSFKGVEKCYAIQAGREVRVITKPNQIDDAQTLFLAKDIAKKIEAEMVYPGQIKVNVIREFRGTEYAK